MENLGIVGEALKKRILEVSRRLTKDEIEFLAAQGIVPRGTGFVDQKTNRFVSNEYIDGIINDYRGKVAVKVDSNAAVATRVGGADVVYEVVSSINDSIEQLFGILSKPKTEAPTDAVRVTAGAEAPEASVFDGIIGMFRKIVKSSVFWLIQVAMPIYETIKAAVHSLFDFVDDLKTVFIEKVFPFFTETLPTIFDSVKEFFTEKIPEYFNMFMYAAKEAVIALLDFPKKILFHLENYALTFGKDLIGKFEPWLKKVGLDTENAHTALNERQKQIQKDRSEVEKRAREAEAARAAVEKQRRETVAAAAAKRQEKPTPIPPVPKQPAVPAPAAPPPKEPAVPAPAAPPPKEPAVSAGKPSLESVTSKSNGVDTNNLNPSLKERVAAMAADYQSKTGKKLLITSGYRSNEKQKELWDEELRRQGGNVAKARKLVAPPPPIGKGSKHASGMAIDINSKGSDGLNVLAGDRTQSTGWLERFGLIRPVANENWHVQLAGDAPSPDNPDEPGKPTIIPGSRKLLGDGRPKDVTAQYEAQVDKKGSLSSLAPGVSPAADLLLPTQPVADALNTASQKVGVDTAILYAIAKQESGFNPAAASKGTSAKGLFQFVNNTWDAMVKQYQSSFPELKRGPLDPIANAIAGALYIKSNIAALAKKGIPATATNIYAAHFLGTSGASKLLSADDKAIAASIVPSAANANKNIFYSEGKPRTVAEVIKILYGKVGQYAEKYAAVVTPTTGTMVAAATKAADIKPPKTTVAAAKPTTPAADVKTAAISSGKEQTASVAAVVRGYKSYFAIS